MSFPRPVGVSNAAINQEFKRLKELVENYEKKLPSAQELQKTKEGLEKTQSDIAKVLKTNPMTVMIFGLASNSLPKLIKTCETLLGRITPLNDENTTVSGQSSKEPNETEETLSAPKKVSSLSLERLQKRKETLRKPTNKFSKYDIMNKVLISKTAGQATAQKEQNSTTATTSEKSKVLAPVSSSTQELTIYQKLLQLSALYDAPKFSQEAFIVVFNMLPLVDQNNLKGAIWCEAGKPLTDNDFGGTSVFTRASEEYVKNAVRRYVNIQAARNFQSVLNSSVGETVVKDAFTKLPGALQDKLKLGFWLLEGMPKGDADFGGSFFQANSRSETVKKILDAVIINDGRLFSENERLELTAIQKIVATRDAEKIRAEFSAHSATLDLIKKSIWVENGRPLDKGVDFSGDRVRGNPLDPSIKTVVDSLATLGMN